MKPDSRTRAWPLLLALAGAATVQAALVNGGTAFTKRFETNLLADPNPLAAVAARLTQVGIELHIQEVKGPWVRVRAASGSGWVYGGNVAEKKPDEVVNSNGPVVVASKTTATAAARGLSDVADGYATRRNLGQARNDLNWLEQQGGSVSRDDVDQFLREQKKGEYQ